ncbi:MAG TPA: dihydrofolate reductase [Xanthobacteraceae bacterium]|jgi:dihydrofolate reductase|uniref:dihydrofolate reductase n=1 Tax=Roseixanthobacter finlandensis TaxID=3119922 RepID=UPI000BD1E63E|nr:MAG: diacylglycerol kinase [Rhizobiales bacterium 35-66-30]OZA95574.1 MAG: diacylglycerol kinase [Rhizobiales bacterium 39-66-18]HQS11036.1 dihydrofolate reductase [Xanthobacteraceae bacterium]HQS48937.1 dihydrofolate reductase [Xanthobacteraceae bacterium]
MLPLAHIVAVAENGVIGRNQTLPWHLSSDLKRFRALTWGRPLLMGRNTFLSIGRPLPGRISIVLTGDPAFTAEGGMRVGRDLGEALTLAEAAALELGAEDIMVIGGRRVFAETLPLASTIHLTRVHASPPGDVLLPPYDPAEWREVERDGPMQGPKDDFPFSYITLTRD